MATRPTAAPPKKPTSTVVAAIPAVVSTNPILTATILADAPITPATPPIAIFSHKV